MVEIKTFAITSLKLGQHCNFHKSINNLIAETTPAVLHIETQATRYAALLADEQAIINRQKAYMSTPELKAADKDRDHLTGVIMTTIRINQTNPIATKQDAAKKLYIRTQAFKNITEHEYSLQTSETDGLIEVLKSEECAPWVETLGITAEVELLEEVNAKVQAALNLKAEENVARMSQTETDSERLRTLIDTVYHEIVKIVNAFAIAIPSDEITAFINKVNGTIQVYRDISDQGSGKKPENDETTPDTDGGTTPDEGNDTTPDIPTEPEEDEPVVQ